ncbi:hypothetical protein HYW67_02200 [Candidatus Parcubacteria bacterium]|nr:hypothetical protein [Candidatus Parcubacteria bacterium]
MRRSKQTGAIVLPILIFGGLAAFLIGGFVQFAVSEHQAGRAKAAKELALQIAEAGIDYYKWHLAHDSADFQDGTGGPGPYLHDYRDKDGNLVGQFSLEITPPPVGSSVVQVRSTGWSVSFPQVRRSVLVRVGFPSLVDYAFLTNTDVWIGDTEAVHGKLHANGGIRFDGTDDAPITSAKLTYICKQHHGCGNQERPGIWGDGGPTSFWQFPVPAQDFNGITIDLANLKTLAQSSGIYLGPSGTVGYRLQLNADRTVSIFRVTGLRPSVIGMDVNGITRVESNDIQTTELIETRAIPTSGAIFVEDKVWVDGTVSGYVTIGSGRFPDNPATRTTIVISGNIIYVAKDGTHALGLIAQQNILIPRYSPDQLEIDAAVLAQNGSAQRYYYPGNILDRLVVYGSIITNGVWTWSWVSGGGAVVSGYRNTDTTYDANLTYAPPPGFPVGNSYNQISWEEK